MQRQQQEALTEDLVNMAGELKKRYENVNKVLKEDSQARLCHHLCTICKEVVIYTTSE